MPVKGFSRHADTYKCLSSLLPESRFLSSSRTALQGPGPPLLPVLGRGSGGSWSWRSGGRQASMGRDSGLTQHWAREGRLVWLWFSSWGRGGLRPLVRTPGMALACVGSRAPSLWPYQAAQSYRQAHPPHDGPASVGLGAEPGASFPVGEGQLDSQGLGCQDGSTCAAQGWPQGGLCSGPALRASARGDPAGHWPGSGQACVLPHRVSR